MCKSSQEYEGCVRQTAAEALGPKFTELEALLGRIWSRAGHGVNNISKIFKGLEQIYGVYLALI